MKKNKEKTALEYEIITYNKIYHIRVIDGINKIDTIDIKKEKQAN